MTIWSLRNKSILYIISLLSNDNSILYDSFNGKSIRDIKLKHNKAFKLNCQLILKNNACDEFFHFYIKAVERRIWKVTIRFAMFSAVIMRQRL